MRVAMLAPIARRIAPGAGGHRETCISLLTDGLIRQAIQVTLFATQDSQTQAELASVCPHAVGGDPGIEGRTWEALHIGEAFARGNEFDLIHNHCDHLPLTYLSATTTPVLTTLYARPSPQALAVYGRARRRAFCVAADPAIGGEELGVMAVIPWTDVVSGMETVVTDYLRVYDRIQRLCRREDHRPWGYYQVLLDEPTQKVKKIVVYPGQRLSLQRHQQRAEHWFVVAGQALVTRNDVEIPLGAGQAVDIPRGAWHRIRNPGADNMAFIEVQTGDYFGEDDIERAEDDYGRTG
jgi:mannose-6-phosphate isomerase-like protein (cupin superfamily)